MNPGRERLSSIPRRQEERFDLSSAIPAAPRLAFSANYFSFHASYFNGARRAQFPVPLNRTESCLEKNLITVAEFVQLLRIIDP
jgi:hypothetical protein